MGDLVKVLNDGRIVVFGKIKDCYGEEVKEAIVVLEGKSFYRGKTYRKIYGITKTDNVGEYFFIINDKSVKYNVAVFEDKYYTENDVIKFIRG